MADYTAAWIGLIGAGIGAFAGLGGQVVQAMTAGGREKRARQHSFNMEKREGLKPIYHKVLDAADMALTVAKQKGLAETGEEPEERDRRHIGEIVAATSAVREVMNDIILESGSSYVVAAVNHLWSTLNSFMIDYTAWVDARKAYNDAAATPLASTLAAQVSETSQRLWAGLPAVVDAHDTLKKRIQDHLFELQQP